MSQISGERRSLSLEHDSHKYSKKPGQTKEQLNKSEAQTSERIAE